jgi:hypothetical protein
MRRLHQNGLDSGLMAVYLDRPDPAPGLLTGCHVCLLIYLPTYEPIGLACDTGRAVVAPARVVEQTNDRRRRDHRGAVANATGTAFDFVATEPLDLDDPAVAPSTVPRVIVRDRPRLAGNPA